MMPRASDDIARLDRHAAALLASIHADAFAGGEIWSEDALASLLSMPGTTALCLRRDAAPLGFVMVRVAAGEAEILTLGVLGAHARRGVGMALVGAAMAEARIMGAERIFLDVSEGNIAARSLYERHGFHAVGRRPAYYHDLSAAFVLMRDLRHLS